MLNCFPPQTASIHTWAHRALATHMKAGWSPVHTETLFSVNAFVLHCFGRSWTQGLRVEEKNKKKQPSRFRVDGKSVYFPKQWRRRPTPRPLASDLWTPRRLITTTTTTTTTMADYMLAFVFLATYSPCSRVWVAAAVRLVVFGFSVYCLFVYSMQALCTCSVSSSPFLENSSVTYRPGRWTTAFWVIFSGSVWTQIFLKQCRGRRRKKRLFCYVWTRSKSATHKCPYRP